ncbi:MAG: adenosine deaminase, partial [Myxococcota bacterium]|nr:adenosine deaminase [Myxococcota bacterium]
ALSRFASILSLLDTAKAVRRVAAEICEDAAADGVTTLEVRFAPQLHGRRLEAIVDAALEGLDGRAGLILCVLYGEPPALAMKLAEVGATRGACGLDLAGAPLAQHDWSIESYAPAFRHAAEQGLGRTVHAGEGRPASEIRTAIELLGAQRIGHGTSLLDDPSVRDLVRERGVTLEACPTSNWHTGVIDAVGQHPLAAWLEQGIRACINTDNTLLSAVQASEEHARARQLPGMTDALLERAIAHGHAAAFRRH